MTRKAVFEASLAYFLEPIARFLDDESVTEIMVNGHDRIFVERKGRLEQVSARFDDEDALVSAIHNLTQYVGRDISPEQPILDARLPTGSRVHAVIPPASRTGPCLTIRKFRPDVLSLDDVVRLGTLSAEAREFLEICIHLHKNVIVAGASGAGKTSLLGALAEAIADDERILIIEDTTELRLKQPHVVQLESRSASGGEGVTLRQLFVAALRMRPDRILVGEVRGGEALDSNSSNVQQWSVSPAAFAGVPLLACPAVSSSPTISRNLSKIPGIPARSPDPARAGHSLHIFLSSNPWFIRARRSAVSVATCLLPPSCPSSLRGSLRAPLRPPR